ncbi:MAG TPA: hypothetical protein VEB69_12675 [Acidimicrobiia bacterium]|nr:hypothetical protein [Acidimicrobiia bacterium]
MAIRLRAPMDAMDDLAERSLFYNTWAKALGPDGATNPTEVWLRAFGGQTKWLPAESWVWWLETYAPTSTVDPHQALGFLSLVIGLLGQLSPSGQAVRYAREMAAELRPIEEKQDSATEIEEARLIRI